MKSYYWVPEDFLFENAGDCLDARPDDGPAALVISETYWREIEHENDMLWSQNKIMRSALEKIINDKKVSCENAACGVTCYDVAREALEKCTTLKTNNENNNKGGQ